MKLAISGSAGTGKTTLAQNIAKQTGWTYIPEFAREACEKLKVKTPREIPDARKLEFQKIILDMKIEAETKAIDFVADRSTIDVLAYYLWWNARNKNCDNDYINTCTKQALNYDMTYFLEWGAFPLVDDGFRSVNEYYQRSIHYLIKGILVDRGIKHFCIDVGTLAQRELVAIALATAQHNFGQNAVTFN